MASDMKSGTLDLNFGPATGKLCISFLLLLLKQDYHKFSGLNNTRFFFFSCLSGSQNSSWAKIKCQHSCVPFRGCNGESFSLLLSPRRGHPTFLGPFLYLQSQQILQRQSSLCSPFSTSHYYTCFQESFNEIQFTKLPSSRNITFDTTVHFLLETLSFLASLLLPLTSFLVDVLPLSSPTP